MRVLAFMIGRLYLQITSQSVHEAALSFLRRMAGEGEYKSYLYLVRTWDWSCNPARVDLLPGRYWSAQVKRAELVTGERLCPVCVTGHGSAPYGAYAIIAISAGGLFFEITEDESMWCLGDEEATLRSLRRKEWHPPPPDEILLCEVELADCSLRGYHSQLAGFGRCLVAKSIHCAVSLTDVWRLLLLLVVLTYGYITLAMKHSQVRR